MKLYFNGCSFTYGDDLVDPNTCAWPALVARSLGHDFVNDAVSGGTNDRTVYRTLLNYDKFDCFFIAWTFYSRFTEHNPVDNFEINFNPQLRLDASLHLSNDLKNNFKKYKDYGEIFYKHWFNEIYEFKKWLQQILLLQAFFQTHHKSYVMLNTAQNHLFSWLQSQDQFIQSTKTLIPFFESANDVQLIVEYQQIQKLNSLIDKKHFIGWNQWYIGELGKISPVGPTGHLLELGHQLIAEKVLHHYNTTL